MPNTFVIMLFIFCLLYVLYMGGAITLTVKRSLVFIGSLNGKRARFTKCSGTLKRIVRFKESRNYYFMLDSAISSGTLSVELLDAKKEPVMKLGSFLKAKNIYVEEKKKYYLIIHFNKATGSYAIDWE